MVEIAVQKVGKSRINEVDLQNPAFGREFTDHMFIVDYENDAWINPRIVPFGDMPVSPALSVFHYGQAIFEGMKAFKSPDREALLFRPQDNHQRFNRSAERMCMAEIPEEIFMEGLKAWLKLEADWIPEGEQGALYIRPFMIATDHYLGVKASSNFRFIIYGCPVNAYYDQRLQVKIEQKYVRAVAGGVGGAKTAGNYAASLYAARIQQAKGYHQLLWTDAIEHKYLEELGTSNFFALIDGKLITPELDGTILDGITRDCVLQLSRHMEVETEERRFKVDELIDALKDGRATECFATGTAATIADIEVIGWQDEKFVLPEVRDGLVSKLRNQLVRIQRGMIDDPFGWCYQLENSATV